MSSREWRLPTPGFATIARGAMISIEKRSPFLFPIPRISRHRDPRGWKQSRDSRVSGLLPATRIAMTRFSYSISVQPVGIVFPGQFLEQIPFSLYKLLLIFHLSRPLHKPLEREDTSLLFVYLKNIGTRDDENRPGIPNGMRGIPPPKPTFAPPLYCLVDNIEIITLKKKE
jgi:hypothetical protein